MGKGTITAHIEAGQYQIKLLLDTVRVIEKIEQLGDRFDELMQQMKDLQVEIENLLSSRDDEGDVEKDDEGDNIGDDEGDDDDEYEFDLEPAGDGHIQGTVTGV